MEVTITQCGEWHFLSRKDLMTVVILKAWRSIVNIQAGTIIIITQLPETTSKTAAVVLGTIIAL